MVVEAITSREADSGWHILAIIGKENRRYINSRAWQWALASNLPRPYS